MMTTTNPNTAFKTTDNTHRHNHTILHHIGRRLLLLTTLLAMAVGVKALDVPANGIYEICHLSSTNSNTRGYLVQNIANSTLHPAEAKLSGYTGATFCYADRKANGINSYWYLYTSEAGIQYIFSVNNGKFLSYTNANGGELATLSDNVAPFIVETSEKNGSYYQIRPKDKANCLGNSIGWGIGTAIRYNPATDDGIPHSFNAINNVTIDQAILNAAIAKIEEYEENLRLVDQAGVDAAKANIAIGVGYPKTTSDAYINLNSLTANSKRQAEVEALITAYKTSTDIQLPEDGKAYQFAFVANDGNNTPYYIVANGNTLSVSATGPGSTFYCKKFTNVNGEERFAFISEEGKLMSFRTLTDIYTATGNLCNDFTVGPMVGVTSNVTSTKEQRFGSVYLTTSARSTENASLGCFVYKFTDTKGWDASFAPFHNGNYTSAIKVTEATPYTANNAQLLAAAKIEAKVSVLGRKIPGAEVCQYTYTVGGEKETDTNTIIEAIEDASTVDAVDAIKESATINQPEVGKCYRIKGYVSGNYLDAINCYTGSQMGIKSYNEYDEQGTMFRLEEGNILYNLGTSSYVYETYKIGANKNNANKWTFTESERTPGCFTLTSDYNAARQLHDNGGIYADRCATICGDSHDFVLIEVEITRTPAPMFVPNDDFTAFTLTCTAEQGTIYYTLDGSDPTGVGAQVLMPGSPTLTINPNEVNIRAYSHKEDIEPSEVVGIVAISTSEQLANIKGSSYYYLATDNITASSHTSITDFRGTFEGRFYTIEGLNAPLFATTNGATIKNVALKNVQISSSASYTGAIVGTAKGKTRIYNCGILSGSIGGGTNVGGIAGRIEDATRVINCYSYADITGGTTVGGIVGYNAGSYVTGVPQTMVMNCAYYGNLNGGANRYPIFGGHNITNNQGDNTYNFFRHNESISYKGYNSAQAIFKDEYLDRFEFYRSILNSHRELAAYYAFNDVSNADEIGKWTLDKSRAPYPIVTKHLSNTQKTLKRTIPVTDEAYAGKKIKDIDVTININGEVYNEKLPVTDMDTARWDYTYGKIVLPFANEFTGWSIGDAQAITGWKVSTKDYYQDLNNVFDNTNYVYAQGGNYIVPEGVTALTLTAYVAPAVYLSDASYDIVYNSSYGSPQGRGDATPTTYKGQTVYNTLAKAIDALTLTSNTTRPYEQAIVLVGNYHYNQRVESDVLPSASVLKFDTNKPFTLMSVDNNNDQEPDYCFYQYHSVGSGRSLIHPVRFDFLTSPGIGMAAHIEEGSAVPGIGIWHCKGWYEQTETYLGIMSECEMRPANFLVESPWILNGGIFEEINVSSTNEYGDQKESELSYIKIGGNALVNKFYPGVQHANNNSYVTTLKPVYVSGGEVKSCYMTGKQPQYTTTVGNVDFYCNGGYIHEFLGAYMEPLAAGATINVRADHALIDNFYGGGANENYGTPGNINITMNNSRVNFFCGGPKYGNMSDEKTVTINASGSTFGQFYGGGYGGTALTRNMNATSSPDFSGDLTYPHNFTNYTDDRLQSKALGVGVGYDFEFFLYAGGGSNGGGKGVARFFVDYAKLSLATAGSITSTLTNCTILGDYYGGGCQGRVEGNVTSTLTGCTVNGNIFAGGYTAAATPCYVYPSTQPTYSTFKSTLGIFTPFGTTTPDTYVWAQATASQAAGTVSGNTIYTDVDMTKMGEVDGNTTIEIKGDNSHIYGSVFGGGNASKVIGNTHVHIQGGTIDGNVFGAGNQAEVTGTTDVVIGGGE